MNVRLKPFEIEAIITAFDKTFLPTDHLWIFGSRADMSKRGGDIDLYVETTLNSEDAVKSRIKLAVLICDEIGDQRIDVVLNLLNSDTQLPIYAKARREGVQLK